jgi:hypothetical protein
MLAAIPPFKRWVKASYVIINSLPRSIPAINGEDASILDQFVLTAKKNLPACACSHADRLEHLLNSTENMGNNF